MSYSSWDRKELDVTEGLTLFSFKLVSVALNTDSWQTPERRELKKGLSHLESPFPAPGSSLRPMGGRDSQPHVQH